jgi:Uma2 family endonuclease
VNLTVNPLAVPDISVVPARSYWTSNPDRAYLVIEVARTSLHKDREIKTALYADGSVDEYWIVNHVDDYIEVFRDRQGGAWQAHSVHRRGDTIAMLKYPDVVVAVSAVLPPRSRRKPAPRRPRRRAR